MSRYARKIPGAGESAWDALINDNFLNTFDRPLPLIRHAGDISSLAGAFTPSQYDQCVAICQYSGSAGDGYQAAVSDGTTWIPLTQFASRHLIVDNPASPYTLLSANDFVLKSNSTALTVNLPAVASTNKGRKLWVKNKAGTANNVTVSPNGGDTIDGGASLTLTPGQSTILVSSGSGDWLVF